MVFGLGFLSFHLFGGVVWFWIAIVVLLMLFFIAEISSQGFIATIGLAVFLALNWYKGDVPTAEIFTWANAGIYLLLGFIYAVIRTFFYGRDQINISSYTVDSLKENVFRWWLLFPISLIAWTLEDLIGNIWNAIYDICSNGFEYVLKLGNSSRKK